MPVSKDPFILWNDPPSIYRGAPFWSWNSHLDPDRLCRAVESMHSAGMGGFFMHSRYGLKTPYLGEQWFKCIEACIDKAEELGMKACLYDEDRYPSGAAGGLVTRLHREFSMHRLVAGPPESVKPGAKHIATFTVGDETLSFDVELAEPDGWNNDGAYIDTMNPKAVAEFIRLTHQAYADRFREHFRKTVSAIFTDEPQYGNAAILEEGPPRRYVIQWTPALPREFRRRRGYDIREHLVELCVPGPNVFSKVRYDYRRTLTELFVEAFAAQIGRWCRRHRIALTGHWLGEELLARQCHHVGAVMPQYKHEDWPGIDVLMDGADELITVKQCSSVAAQLGRERVLSELYGCTGWDWPLEGHKFNGDWQYACGANFRCQHLTQYSLAGGAKRDYPASIFSHSPWWKCYRTVEDYFARLSYMLTRGTPIRDVLVIHPIESAWGMFVPRKRGTGQPTRWPKGPIDSILNDPLERIIHALTESHHDWDFGDESLLARHARVIGRSFRVGRMSYQLVIVPPAVTLRSSTAALIEEFIAAGGEVLFVGRQPDRIDAEPSTGIADLASQCSVCKDRRASVTAAVEKRVERRLSVAERGRELACVWTMLRKVGRSGRLLFLQSHDRSSARALRVRVEGRGPVVLWDCISGQKTLVKHSEADGYVSFSLRLAPTGSALISLGVRTKEAVPPRPAGRVIATQTLEGPFDIELTEPDSLPLDYCEYRIGRGPFSKPVPSLQADEEIRRRFGLRKRDSHEHQPWYLYSTGAVDLTPRGRCCIRRTFHVTSLPTQCKLAVEMPDRFRITVNGRRVAKVAGFWIDEDIKTIDITRALQTGTNEITIGFNYQPDMELEDMYLVGDFGVNRGRYATPTAGKDTHVRKAGRISLVAQPKRLSLGPWVGQGLDFYGGGVKYRIRVIGPKGGERTVIKLPGVACTAVVIQINEKRIDLPWPPFEADITEALHEGPNDVEIEVIGGRKNILGPLHVPWGPWTGPREFDPNDPRRIEDYLLVGHGLMSPVVLETRSQAKGKTGKSR